MEQNPSDERPDKSADVDHHIENAKAYRRCFCVGSTGNHRGYDGFEKSPSGADPDKGEEDSPKGVEATDHIKSADV